MLLPRLLDIATKNVISLPDQGSIDDAISLMATKNLRDVIITGERGLRILTPRELIQFRLQQIDFSTPLSDVVLNKVPVLHPEATIFQALDVIRNHPDEHLCLLDLNQRLVGIVSYTDLASCLDPEQLAKNTTLADVLCGAQFVKVHKTETAEQVFVKLNQAQQTAAVVFDDQLAIGMITQTDIIKLFNQHASLHLLAEQVMSAPLKTFDCRLSLGEALLQARQHHIKRLVVVDKGTGQTLGVVHQKELVSPVYQAWSEQAINESQRIRLAELSKNIPGMIFELLRFQDGHFGFSFASPAIVDLFDLTFAEINADATPLFSRVHLEDRDELLQLIESSASALTPWSHEFRVILPSGLIRWLSAQATPSIQSDHAIIWHGFMHDITNHKMQQFALEQAKRDAEAANQAKSEFLANMSHEIRTPLNGVLGLSELAMQQSSIESMRDYLQKVHYSGRLLLGIINDILDLSKIQANKLTLDPQPFSLAQWVDNLYDLFSANAKAKNLHFEVNVLADTSLCLVGDSFRLRQVVSNLLSNAIKFTEQGEVRLKIEQVSDSVPGLRFSIQDTGIGLSQEQISRLFQAFSQADSSITRKYGGTGLGLVISQHLIDLLGGSKIQVESALNQGACFSFDLPVICCSEQQAHGLKAQTQAVSQASFSGRVLLVEDNEINQLVAQEQLKNLGLTVSLAQNGKIAVEALRQQAFDLVLMDIQMPVMDGYQATLAMREFNLDIPIVALTAAAMVEDKNKALQCGMNDHLSKPINFQDLHRVLSRFLPKNILPMSELRIQSSSQSAEFTMLNVTAGLEQLTGNQRLYSNLLVRFCEQLRGEFASLIADLRDLHFQPRPLLLEQVQQSNHALKGVAGNLAIEGLFVISQQIDAGLKHDSLPSLELVETFEQAINTALNEIALYLKGVEGDVLPGDLDKTLDKDKLFALKQRIEASEFIEDNDILAIGNTMTSDLKPIWHQTVKAIEDLDFERAASQLAQIIARI
jgi:signal transduction histidine kinase/DNA-binding NarL/FixJ family response regulator/predicted transcriptional regulator